MLIAGERSVVSDETGPIHTPLATELQTIESIHRLLEPLSTTARERVVAYVVQALEIPHLAEASQNSGSAQFASQLNPTVTDQRVGEVKRVFATKRPQSDIERVLVLASHVVASGEPFFDSARLADERVRAAAHPFNVIEAAKSAVKKGYFAPAGEGKRQLTVLGEEVAAALPDRQAVSALLSNAEPRQSPKRRSRS